MNPATSSADKHHLLTFGELWPTLPIPGEFDSMDRLDQARWRGVIGDAFYAGRRSGDSYEAMLRNLLARIHGDGGHYVEQHGVDKAAAAADALVAAWRAAA